MPAPTNDMNALMSVRGLLLRCVAAAEEGKGRAPPTPSVLSTAYLADFLRARLVRRTWRDFWVAVARPGCVGVCERERRFHPSSIHTQRS